MRCLAVVGTLVAAVILSGCSDGGEPRQGGEEPVLEDFGVGEVATGRGVLLGVVVDDTITPIEGVTVRTALPDGSPAEDTSDAEGRFAFGDLLPGTYLIEATHPQYAGASSTAEVVADVAEPRIHRMQLVRLFDQAPYHEQIVFEGFLACAYAIGVSSTCINDYTRVTGERCLPTGQCYCAGGCLRDQELAKQGGNIREYVSVVGPGWQSLVIEAVWEPTSQFGEQLGFTTSFFSRPDAVHRYGGTGGPSPLRLQLDTGVEHDSAQLGAADHTIVPANGTQELFTFFSAAGGGVALNQQFRAYETHFYYGIIPEGWSFVNGDPFPF